MKIEGAQLETETATISRALPSPLLALVVLLAALVIGFGLGIVVRGPNVLDIDAEITAAIQRSGGGAIELLADAGNLIGSTAGAAVVIVVAIAIAAAKRATPELVFLSTMLVLRLLGTQLKPIFASPRPTDEFATIIATFDGTGYPSGHALTASTMALGLSVIAWRRIPSRRWSMAAMVALMVLGLVIGWARVWSGAHWASDVIGGYVFGVAIVAAAILVVHRFDDTLV